jgi:hypothetical protein
MNQEEKNVKIRFNVLAIICIILFSFSLAPVTLQNDTYYTIKIGEHIINEGIDMQDPFSWHENLPYTYPHWAYDTATYLIYNLGQHTGIHDGGMLFIYITTVILACVLGVLLYITITHLSKNNLISFVLTMFAMYLLKDFIAARAQLVTFILFVLTILFIEKFLETKKKRYFIGIILISIVIANVHCAVWPFFFVLFLPYVAEYIIASILDFNVIGKSMVKYREDNIHSLEKKIAKEKDEEKKNILVKKLEEAKEILEKTKEKSVKIKVKEDEKRANPFRIKIEKNSAAKWLILLMIICAFTGLLTPIGDTPYTYLIKTMQGNTTKSISEHQPLTLYNDKATMIVLALVLGTLIFTDVKVKLSDLFMVGGLIFLSFMSRRQVSLLILIGVPIFAKWINYIVCKYDKKGFQKITKFVTTFVGKIIILIIVAFLSLAYITPKKDNKFIDDKKYPVAAADWMLENLDVKNIKLYNEYNYGSYLLFRGIPVFIDSRADLYAPEFNKKDGEEGRNIFSDYINISAIGTYYETKFEKYGITHVIVVNNAKLNLFLSRSDKYKQLYKDDSFVIYERES